jgi:hypothetical protein
MSAGTLVCWRRDGTPKIARVLTGLDQAINELEHSAEMLAEAYKALIEQADQIEWRDEGTAEHLRTVAARCRWQERDARTMIAKQTAEV